MKPAGDEHMGAFVYCASHLRAHSTGWCTVGPLNKIPMPGATWQAAHAVADRLGLDFFDGNRQEPMSALERERFNLMHPLAYACQQRHCRSWLTPQPHRDRRDLILRRLADIRTALGLSKFINALDLMEQEQP